MFPVVCLLAYLDADFLRFCRRSLRHRHAQQAISAFCLDLFGDNFNRQFDGAHELAGAALPAVPGMIAFRVVDGRALTSQGQGVAEDIHVDLVRVNPRQKRFDIHIFGIVT